MFESFDFEIVTGSIHSITTHTEIRNDDLYTSSPNLIIQLFTETGEKIFYLNRISYVQTDPNKEKKYLFATNIQNLKLILRKNKFFELVEKITEVTGLTKFTEMTSETSSKTVD